LIDGSLILWDLETFPDFVNDALLQKGLLAYLEQIRKLNEDREIPIASYISYPRSNDVTNTLRVALCPMKQWTATAVPNVRTRECDFITVYMTVSFSRHC